MSVVYDTFCREAVIAPAFTGLCKCLRHSFESRRDCVIIAQHFQCWGYDVHHNESKRPVGTAETIRRPNNSAVPTGLGGIMNDSYPSTESAGLFSIRPYGTLQKSLLICLRRPRFYFAMHLQPPRDEPAEKGPNEAGEPPGQYIGRIVHAKINAADSHKDA
jgi:hypothetical protein